MGFLADLKQRRRRSQAWDEAYAFRQAGDFASAAKVCEGLAAGTLTDNELIYESDCHDAMKDWLKAHDVENALANARNALRVIAASNWFPADSTVDDICEMVGEFYTEGYATVADMFANEINAEYVKHNLPVRFTTKHGKFPTNCPQCGGTLPFTYSDVSVTCPFCSAVVRPE
jgi:hypothetical protein